MSNNLTSWTIVDLQCLREEGRDAAAALLVAGFRERAPHAWPDLAAGLQEVAECLVPERIARSAIAPDGTMLGWIGGMPNYHGRVWELHPLVVAPAYHGRGIGRALTLDFENEVRLRGGLTVQLGTDDEAGETTLAGRDLYPDVLDHLQRLDSARRHPCLFYRRMGYAVVGVVPDANGFGKPDILMAKRVGTGYG